MIAPSPRTASPDASAPRTTRRLADIVHEQLDRLIARGEFPKGCKLPPEGELATRFGVSRPVIRDALLRLKEAGYVRSQRGSGTIVVRGEAPGKHAYPPIRTVADLLRSYEFRITVETATAAMAAERRVPSDLADLDKTLDRAARALDATTPHLLADLNFEFTVRVAQGKDRLPNFLGPFVQGPPRERFVYLDIGTYAGQTGSLWSRRLKVPLRNITWDMIKQASDSAKVLEARVPGTGKDNGPNCGTVKPFSGWQVNA